MRSVKVLEILIMLVAAVGWYTHQLWVLVLSVVGMGLHSTLFGPVKHSYLPQHLDAVAVDVAFVHKDYSVDIKH